MAPLDTSVGAVVANLGSHGALAAVRTLGRLGVAVHGVHHERTPAFRSRYLAGTSLVAVDRLGDELLALGTRLGNRPVLFSAGDAETAVMIDRADELSAVYRLPQTPPAVLRDLVNKRRLSVLCEERGMPVVRSRYPTTRDEAAAVADELDFPLLVKAVDPQVLRAQSNATAVAIVDNVDELVLAFAGMDGDVVVQEFVPGDDWLFDGYFRRGGECVAAFTGRKVHQCPPRIGTTSLGVHEPNEAVASSLVAFLGGLAYEGVVDCDVRRDERDGTFKLLDVNPRVGEAFRLFTDDGDLDVVRMQYLDLTGNEVRPGTVRVGRKWAVELNEAVALMQWRGADDAPAARAYLGALRGVDEVAWFATDDLAPVGAVGAVAARRLARFVRKAW
ncbi:MAG TPA: hypothetical protein VM938_13955 [Acidimicrobiales bacterium]|nr:hypothetical protein [Acidimicrobiales bacterium]